MIILETWLAAVMGLVFFGSLCFLLLILISKDLKEEKMYEQIYELTEENNHFKRCIRKHNIKLVLKENGDE